MAQSLQAHLAEIQVPTPNSHVYRDECVYSFDSPETATGLYVSLSSFLAFGKDHVDNYYQHTKNAVFLHIYREKRAIPSDPAAAAGPVDGPEKKIKRLAIGVEGGFDPDAGKAKFEYEDHLSVVVLPAHTSIPYPSADLPLQVVKSIQGILGAESASAKLNKESFAGTWDGEARLNSKFAENLVQLNNGKTIPPSGWKCEECDLTSNLWLNLTDGSILCGRRFFDGSGGNDHAVKHYADVKYPLAVKLGTITSDGKGDVYSYAEDDMVLDPHLVEHLAHFGIKTNQLEKTEKSMVELEIDMNERIGEWSILTESTSQLEPISGPGYTGMKNLGNSCYLNSVMQVVFSVDDFVELFEKQSSRIFGAFPADPANDFNVQMSKLAVGLWSGKYSSVAENSLDSDSTGISPVMFKNLIGRNHPDFSTKQQQDAQEFVLHLFQLLEKHTPNGAANPANALRFVVEDRFECGDSGKVKYTTRDEFCLPLQIPLHKASNYAEVKEYEERLAAAEATGVRLPADSLVRPKITLQDCLDAFTQTELVEQFYSTAIDGKTTAKKSTRFGTLPKYLLLQLKKFTLRSDWTSVKLDVAVDIPDELDLQQLRGHGLQPNEVALPELTAEVPPPAMDETVIMSLAEMGFNIESCKRAVFFTKNSGLENATQWLMEHITDFDFNDPFIPPGTNVSQQQQQFTADPVCVEQLQAMGFTDVQIRVALKETNNNVEQAAEYIFTHQMEIDTVEASTIGVDVSPDTNAPAAPDTDRQDRAGSKYKLKAFISHMGTSSQVGHYVCHINRNGKWVIFNDGKVAISQNPPKELGYLYLYESA